MPQKYPRRTQQQAKEPENRDPKGINSHFKAAYPDVLGEPDGAKSFDCIWSFSRIAYDCFLSLCYNLFTCFFGICIAAEWGYNFGLIAFQHIWFISPCVKVISIVFGSCQKVLKACCDCCIKPLMRAIGHIFVACKTEGVDYDDDPLDGLRKRPKKIRIIQTPKRKNKVEPDKPKREEPKAEPVPAGLVISSLEEPPQFLGDREKMKRSVQRQLML